MKTFLLISAFLALWTVVGFIALAAFHDWRARRGKSCTVTLLQIILGGPALWFLEFLNVLHRRN